VKIYGVTGWKNAGKTTLMERLVAEIAGRGFTVSTIKHAHHDTDVDQPGRDSYRHRAAGASEVVLASPKRWALMHELRGGKEWELDDLLPKLSPVDLVLVEGYKNAAHPKVEAYRQANSKPPLAARFGTIRAIASDAPLETDLPLLDLNDTAAIADFILAEVGL
jgi:molybdopterin-guanine dinucleotide biosynthesis protein MobB